jgi:hypothetical protein
MRGWSAAPKPHKRLFKGPSLSPPLTVSPHPPTLSTRQLERLKRHGVRLTVCVDKVAASGGYMLACVADRLLASPWAVVGSIGVTYSVPFMNIERLLSRVGIQAYKVHAGNRFSVLVVTFRYPGTFLILSCRLVYSTFSSAAFAL